MTPIRGWIIFERLVKDVVQRHRSKREIKVEHAHGTVKMEAEVFRYLRDILEFWESLHMS